MGNLETGGAVEVLLLKELKGTVLLHTAGTFPFRDVSPCVQENRPPVWECLTRPGAKTKAGTKLTFADGQLTATITSETTEGNRIIEFHTEHFYQDLEKLGKMPLPPYIREELKDSERYQTVYSRHIGSAAAPTAGLHFTESLLNQLREQEIKLAFMTLHVGLGTFRPVKTDNIEDHTMHSEYFIISDETVKIINETRTQGGRIIAVGTTSCRALEAQANQDGYISAFSGFTDIFIYPGYQFKCIDGLITNFHLPESTLIMLVSAFAGRENVLRAYQEAINEQYRFFSFGDSMLII
jgi:S-adenosylmethionine:tRNA ribosyltransferase-isomerase